MNHPSKPLVPTSAQVFHVQHWTVAAPAFKFPLVFPVWLVPLEWPFQVLLPKLSEQLIWPMGRCSETGGQRETDTERKRREKPELFSVWFCVSGSDCIFSVVRLPSGRLVTSLLPPVTLGEASLFPWSQLPRIVCLLHCQSLVVALICFFCSLVTCITNISVLLLLLF